MLVSPPFLPPTVKITMKSYRTSDQPPWRYCYYSSEWQEREDLKKPLFPGMMMDNSTPFGGVVASIDSDCLPLPRLQIVVL